MFDFIKGIGSKIFGSEEEAPEKLKEHVENDNPGIENLQIEMPEEGTVVLKGEAESQDAVEKGALMVGNVEGVEKVDVSQVEIKDQVVEESSEQPQKQVEFYEIQEGDTLWKIAEKFYGDGNMYQKIFEDNKEVIKDPNKIYPGQKIRIVLEDSQTGGDQLA